MNGDSKKLEALFADTPSDPDDADFEPAPTKLEGPEGEVVNADFETGKWW